MHANKSFSLIRRIGFVSEAKLLEATRGIRPLIRKIMMMHAIEMYA